MKLFTGWSCRRAGFYGCGGKCAGFGALRKRAIALYGRLRRRRSLSGMPPDPARYGHGPTLMPATEVYTVLARAGFCRSEFRAARLRLHHFRD